MPLPTLTLSTSNTEINLLLNDDGEKSKEKDDACKHKILKLNGGLESCSLTDSPLPVCTIVIEEPDGHVIRCHTPSEEPDSGLINCHTPSSIADDEVFVLWQYVWLDGVDNFCSNQVIGELCHVCGSEYRSVDENYFYSW